MQDKDSNLLEAAVLRERSVSGNRSKLNLVKIILNIAKINIGLNG